MTKIVIGNWKMKLGLKESQRLSTSLKKITTKDVEVVVCPSFISLPAVSQKLKKSKIKLGGQDCFWEVQGAYTGEVSALELRELGCDFVIVGHSERRKYLNENDEIVHSKTKAALEAGLIPIVCVGETFEQRQEGHQDYILIQQTTKALEGIELLENQRLIVAYEPVWVIGSGQAIDPHQAASAHQIIRQTLIDLFPLELVKKNIRIIYGGSVDGGNVTDFTNLPDTSGVLVGAASLKAEEFIKIIKAI